MTRTSTVVMPLIMACTRAVARTIQRDEVERMEARNQKGRHNVAFVFG